MATSITHNWCDFLNLRVPAHPSPPISALFMQRLAIVVIVSMAARLAQVVPLRGFPSPAARSNMNRSTSRANSKSVIQDGWPSYLLLPSPKLTPYFELLPVESRNGK